ncbi:FHA domain-containing protein [Gramella sp. KN1008]|uniref:FHA domain-containing protein n=1 Tax=Gramella sp. KN1008 TaxID=2529298 RepID=UPI00103FCAF9|nr:FHA domain-containing protein [Gramella sp. KN1008]TBW28254.1 FHA domain-containing protein [Gramella sp. KN1008]
MTFYIGRNSKNDLHLASPSVSGEHAKVSISDDYQSYTIEDLNSTNGTYINGQAVAKKELSKKDKIVFGDKEVQTEEFFEKIKAFIHEKRTDFSEEFMELQVLERKFQKDKDKANKFFKIKSAALRLAVTVGIMLVVAQFTPREYRIYLMGAIGLIGTVISTLSMSEDRLRNRIEDLTVEFMSAFSCPKCNMELAGKSWKYWRSKKNCPKCKCTWAN